MVHPSGKGSQVQKLTVPALGESVTEATVISWYKEIGQTFHRDEVLLELETDKVTLEVPAPDDGQLVTKDVKDGDRVKVGQILGEVTLGAVSSQSSVAQVGTSGSKKLASESVRTLPHVVPETGVQDDESLLVLSPTVRKMVAENQLEPAQIPGTGKGGRITKQDVKKFMANQTSVPRQSAQAAPIPDISRLPTEPTPVPSITRQSTHPQPMPQAKASAVERVPMTRLRQTIAHRLKEAQNTAAMLTTFNEVDMSQVIEARARLKDRFEKKYGVKLGFMSFFVKACLLGLKEIPEANAVIEGNEIVYRNYYNVGVAVGTPQGLVVPVVRQAQSRSLAEIEQEIASLASRARLGKLSVDDLSRGTFTISNGGVYGSLLSTPILNPPQSAILGMHKIEKRPVVVDDQVVIRPMMYLALTYDHRLIDGQQAVRFLVRVKECLEDLQRILLEI
ncbi:MAG: 2-oxoglutarate dehydrogenase complex dihydrolipoyllysine-residue succinyltransferase [Pseudomonadota bacterium]